MTLSLSLSLSLPRFIYKLLKIRLSGLFYIIDRRSNSEKNSLRNVTFNHRDKHRASMRLARNINCTMRHTSWPLPDLLSRFVEFIEPADTNRFVTARKSISHDRRASISLSLLPRPSSPLDLCLVAGTLLLSVFCNSARQNYPRKEGEGGGGKEKLLIQGYKIPPSMDFERPPTTRALSNILFAFVPLENAASIEAK